MAGAYIGVSSKARKIKSIYVGVNGKARKVTKVYVGVNGVARLVYSASPDGLALSSLPVGTLIKLKENGTATPFYLACHNYESGLNGSGRSLLVRKNCHTAGAASNGSTTTAKNTYAGNLMDTWHNSTYKPTLSANVQSLIGTTTFYYTPGGATSGIATQVTTLSRSVFQLSLTELGKTASSVNTEGSALPIASTLVSITNDAGTGVGQWTRSPRYASTNMFSRLSSSGTVSANNASSTNSYYRPAFTLPASALVDATPNGDGSYTLIE